jgi:hypothetical protein
MPKENYVGYYLTLAGAPNPCGAVKTSPIKYVHSFCHFVNILVVGDLDVDIVTLEQIVQQSLRKVVAVHMIINWI